MCLTNVRFVRSAKEREVETAFCDESVPRSGPCHQILGVTSHDSPRLRKKCCLPICVHVLISFEHDRSVMPVSSLLRSCLLFPIDVS